MTKTILRKNVEANIHGPMQKINELMVKQIVNKINNEQKKHKCLNYMTNTLQQYIKIAYNI